MPPKRLEVVVVGRRGVSCGGRDVCPATPTPNAQGCGKRCCWRGRRWWALVPPADAMGRRMHSVKVSMKASRESSSATPYVISYVVGLITAGVTWGLLAAIGRTSGLQDILLIAVATLSVTFATALGMTRHARRSAIVSSLLTLTILGVGLGLLYAFAVAICGAHSSDC
jgi:hypothetical protein